MRCIAYRGAATLPAICRPMEQRRSRRTESRSEARQRPNDDPHLSRRSAASRTQPGQHKAAAGRSGNSTRPDQAKLTSQALRCTRRRYGNRGCSGTDGNHRSACRHPHCGRHDHRYCTNAIFVLAGAFCWPQSAISRWHRLACSMRSMPSLRAISNIASKEPRPPNARHFSAPELAELVKAANRVAHPEAKRPKHDRANNEPYETYRSDSRLRFSYPVILLVMPFSNRAEVRNSACSGQPSSANYRDLCWQQNEGPDSREGGFALAHRPFRETQPASTGRCRLSRARLYLAAMRRSLLVSCGSALKCSSFVTNPCLRCPALYRAD